VSASTGSRTGTLPHVDPSPPAPANVTPATSAAGAPSAPADVTVALETAAGGRRAHQRCPGRPGGLGHPAAPILTAPSGPRLRPGDRPDPAGTEVGVDGPGRAVGAHHHTQPLDPHRSHRAGGPQQADQRWWTGHGPGQGWPDDHGRAHHDHAGHHDQYRAPPPPASRRRPVSSRPAQPGRPSLEGRQPAAISAPRVGPLLPVVGLRSVLGAFCQSRRGAPEAAAPSPSGCPGLSRCSGAEPAQLQRRRAAAEPQPTATALA